MHKRFEHFTLLINKIYRDIQKIKLEELKKFGLKGSHMTCLHYLGTTDEPLSFKELCETCNEDKSLISKNLKSLIELGLVNRDFPDRKIYKGKFTLSKKGKEIFEEVEANTRLIASNIYLEKSETEIEYFYSNLEEISDKLSDQIEKLRGKHDKDSN